MHPNQERAHRFLDAYASGDLDTVGELLADDITWHVAGDHPMAQVLEGREAVLAYFAQVQEQTAGTLTLEPIEILADDERGAMFLRVRGEREGRTLDVTMAEAFAVGQDGRWTRFWALSNDRDAVDAFWA